MDNGSHLGCLDPLDFQRKNLWIKVCVQTLDKEGETTASAVDKANFVLEEFDKIFKPEPEPFLLARIMAERGICEKDLEEREISQDLDGS